MIAKRLNNRSRPLVIGLTGSIGMGKTTIARMFSTQGVAVLDSDQVVHRLLGENGKAVEAVAELFPNTKNNNSIDREMLGKEVFAQPEKLKKLEVILHPLVQQVQKLFITRMKRKGKKAVLLDIPLLFETGAEAKCHAVVVVSAPTFIQKQRVMRRAYMTEEKFVSILNRQMPDKEKRKRADMVIDSGLGKARSHQQVCIFLKKALHTFYERDCT